MKKTLLSLLALLLAVLTTQVYFFYDDHQLTLQKYTSVNNVIEPINPLILDSNIFQSFSREELEKSLVKDLDFNNAILTMKVKDIKPFKSLSDIPYDIYTIGKDSLSYTIITDKKGYILFADINDKNPKSETISLLQQKLPKDKLSSFYSEEIYYSIDVLNKEPEKFSIVYSFHTLESSFDYINAFIFNKQQQEGSTQFTYSKENNELNIYIKNDIPLSISYEELIKNISHSLFIYIK